MSSIPTKDTEKVAASYLNWWRDAGVDELVGQGHRNWLEEPVKAATRHSNKAEKDNSPSQRSTTEAEETSKTPELDKAQWPNGIATLAQMLARKANLPGNLYGGSPVIPSAISTPKIMVIGDIPSEQDVKNGNFADGPDGTMVRRIMQAIGIAPEEYVFTAMATTRPATGALPDRDFPALSEFMMHQIGLYQPEKVIIFGSAACQALLSADMMEMRGSLHYFNHNVHKVAAVTTFHPRTLLTRPQMKRQAWKDLRVLL